MYSANLEIQNSLNKVWREHEDSFAIITCMEEKNVTVIYYAPQENKWTELLGEKNLVERDHFPQGTARVCHYTFWSTAGLVPEKITIISLHHQAPINILLFSVSKSIRLSLWNFVLEKIKQQTLIQSNIFSPTKWRLQEFFIHYITAVFLLCLAFHPMLNSEVIKCNQASMISFYHHHKLYKASSPKKKSLTIHVLHFVMSQDLTKAPV